MSAPASMSLTEALTWALQRIRTSGLGEGEYFARAEESLENATRLEAERAVSPHLVIPLTIIRDDKMGMYYAFAESLPNLAIGTEELLDLLPPVGAEINMLLSAQLRPYEEWAGAVVTLADNCSKGDTVTLIDWTNNGLPAGTHRLYASLDGEKQPPLTPAGWLLPSGTMCADAVPPLGVHDEHLRPLCRQLFTLKPPPTADEILASIRAVELAA